MRMSEVQKIIDVHKQIQKTGFRVSCERVERSVLVSVYFPEDDEKPFPKEEDAWYWANEFAKATFGTYINIYVVDSTFRPVDGYEERMIINR